MFNCRIVSTDHYQTRPIRELDVAQSEFRNAPAQQVPVLRIYGVTPSGQKTCMHIHGIFPYMYIPYDGGQDHEKYMRQFASSIDKALNVAMGKPTVATHHVFKITLVSGLPFYGFYKEEIPFMKIYLYNPLMIKKVADLLCGGAIMNKVYQPHEAHLPYHLQIFIDYNLYGMNMINVAAVKFRRPTENQDYMQNSPNESSTCGFDSMASSPTSASPSFIMWNSENIAPDQWLDREVAPRQSTCELEVDVVAADILNRLEVGDNVGSNPGLAAIWEDERQRRRERASSQDIAPPESPGRGDVPWSEAEEELQERLAEIIEQLQPYVRDEEESPTTSQAFAATPSSSVDLHNSQTQDEDNLSTASQDTVIFEESEEQAIVNARSILQVVASSQSFRQEREILQQEQQERDQVNLPPESQPTNLDTTQDVAEMLASLADDDDVSGASQQVISQLSAHAQRLEEQDSILSQVSTQSSGKGNTPAEAAVDPKHEEDNDDTETLEMSQAVWEGVEDEEEEKTEKGNTTFPVDLVGLDCSWNSSQLQDVATTSVVSENKTEAFARSDESDSEMSDILPQFDGTGDNKTAMPPKKRLGMRGPITSPTVNAAENTSLSADGATANTQQIESANEKAHSHNAVQEVKSKVSKSPKTSITEMSPTRPRSSRASKDKCVAFLKDVTTSKTFQLDQYQKFPDSISTTQLIQISPVKETAIDDKKSRRGKVELENASKRRVKNENNVSPQRKIGRPTRSTNVRCEQTLASPKTRSASKSPEKTNASKRERNTKTNKLKLSKTFKSAAQKKYDAYMQPQCEKQATDDNKSGKDTLEVKDNSSVMQAAKRGRRRKSDKPTRIDTVKLQTESDENDREKEKETVSETDHAKKLDVNEENKTNEPTIKVTHTEEVKNVDDVSRHDTDDESAVFHDASDLSDDEDRIISSPLIVRRRGSSDSSGSNDSFGHEDVGPSWLVGPHMKTYGEQSGSGSSPRTYNASDIDAIFRKRSPRPGERTPPRDRSPRSTGSKSPRSPRYSKGSKSPRIDEKSPNSCVAPSKAACYSPGGSSSKGSSRRKGGSPRRLSVEKRTVSAPKYSDISDDETNAVSKPISQRNSPVKRQLDLTCEQNNPSFNVEESKDTSMIALDKEKAALDSPKRIAEDSVQEKEQRGAPDIDSEKQESSKPKSEQTQMDSEKYLDATNSEKMLDENNGQASEHHPQINDDTSFYASEKDECKDDHVNNHQASKDKNEGTKELLNYDQNHQINDPNDIQNHQKHQNGCETNKTNEKTNNGDVNAKLCVDSDTVEHKENLDDVKEDTTNTEKADTAHKGTNALPEAKKVIGDEGTSGNEIREGTTKIEYAVSEASTETSSVPTEEIGNIVTPKPRKKKVKRSEADRLVDDSTINLSQDDSGRKRERRKVQGVQEPVKTPAQSVKKDRKRKNMQQKNDSLDSGSEGVMKRNELIEDKTQSTNDTNNVNNVTNNVTNDSQNSANIDIEMENESTRRIAADETQSSENPTGNVLDSSNVTKLIENDVKTPVLDLQYSGEFMKATDIIKSPCDDSENSNDNDVPLEAIGVSNKDLEKSSVSKKTSKEKVAKELGDENDTDGPPMLEHCNSVPDELEKLPINPKPLTDSETIDEDCPILEKFERGRSRSTTPSAPQEDNIVLTSQLSQQLEAAYRKSAKIKIFDGKDDEENASAPQNMIDSAIEDQTGCDDFPISESDNSLAQRRRRQLKKGKFKSEIVVKGLAKNIFTAENKRMQGLTFPQRRAVAVKEGKLFKQDPDAVNEILRELRLRDKRSPKDTVCFPYEIEIKYLKSKKTKGLSHASRCIEGSVRVLKADCKDHDLRQIGGEQLILPLLTDRDIFEMQEQVKLEVAHRRKETQARKLQLAKPLTVPSKTYRRTPYGYYTSDVMSSCESDDDLDKDVLDPTLSSLESREYLARKEDSINDDLSENGRNRLEEDREHPGNVKAKKENIDISKQGIENGYEIHGKKETKGLIKHPQQNDSASKLLDKTPIENTAALKHSKENISESPNKNENENEKDNSEQLTTQTTERGDDSTEKLPASKKQRRKKKGKRPGTGRSVTQITNEENTDNVVEGTPSEASTEYSNVGDSQNGDQGVITQTGTKKKRWRSEAERLADDSTIKLSMTETGRKRERRKTRIIEEQEKAKESVDEENEEDEEELSDDFDYASDDSDKDVTFQPPGGNYDSTSKEEKVPRYRDPKIRRFRVEKPPKPEKKVREKKERVLKPPKLKKERQYINQRLYAMPVVKYPTKIETLVKTGTIKHSRNVTLRDMGLNSRTRPSTTGQVVQHFFSMPVAVRKLPVETPEAPRPSKFFPHLRQQKQSQLQSEDKNEELKEEAIGGRENTEYEGDETNHEAGNMDKAEEETDQEMTDTGQTMDENVEEANEIANEDGEENKDETKETSINLSGATTTLLDFTAASFSRVKAKRIGISSTKKGSITHDKSKMGSSTEREESPDRSTCIDLRGFGSFTSSPVFKQVTAEEVQEVNTPVIKCIPIKRKEVQPTHQKKTEKKNVNANKSQPQKKKEPKAVSFDFDEEEFDIPEIDIPESPPKKTHARALQMKHEREERKSQEFNQLFGDDVTQITISVTKAVPRQKIKPSVTFLKPVVNKDIDQESKKPGSRFEASENTASSSQDHDAQFEDSEPPGLEKETKEKNLKNDDLENLSHVENENAKYNEEAHRVVLGTEHEELLSSKDMAQENSEKVSKSGETIIAVGKPKEDQPNEISKENVETSQEEVGRAHVEQTYASEEQKQKEKNVDATKRRALKRTKLRTTDPSETSGKHTKVEISKQEDIEVSQ